MLNDNVFHAMAFHELLCRGMLRIDDLCIVLRKKQINQTYPIQYFNDLISKKRSRKPRIGIYIKSI